MINRQAEIRKIIKNIKPHIRIPQQVEYVAALDSESERLFALFEEPFAEELFSEDLLKLNTISTAKTLEELTTIIDNLIAAVEFYQDNRRYFAGMITEPFFKKLLAEKGELSCWNELMQHSFKKLHYHQAKLLALDALTRMTPSQNVAKAEPEPDTALGRSPSRMRL